MPRRKQESSQPDTSRQLCPECGLCCSGVLFGDVRLTPSDDPLALEAAGLRLLQLKGQRRFRQPCACFDGRLCEIYGQRPVRCRNFECHTLKQTRSAEIDSAEALRRIRHARQLAAKVTEMLTAMGQTCDSMSMTARYKEIMDRPIDLEAGHDDAELRGQLMLAVHDLMQCVHRDFLE